MRCPKSSGRRGEHLKAFYPHFAKGSYVESLEWCPSNFGDLRQYIDADRETFYLDGPLGVEYVYRNRVLAERESLIYVDYINGGDGNRRWISPPVNEDGVQRLYSASSRIVELVCAISMGGFFSVRALEVIAQKWRAVELRDTMWVNPELYHLNDETLQVLNAAGLLGELAEETSALLVERWSFPMYSIDFSLREVKPADVQRQREEALRQEMGEW